MEIGILNNYAQQKNNRESQAFQEQSEMYHEDSRPLLWQHKRQNRGENIVESKQKEEVKTQIKARAIERVQGYIDSEGCGLIDRMSNDQVVQTCVDLADKAHTSLELLFKFNPVPLKGTYPDFPDTLDPSTGLFEFTPLPNAKGIYRHTTTAVCLEKIQKQCQDRSIKTEEYWRDGIKLESSDSKLGSTRLDVHDTINNVDYECKFEGDRLRNPQIEKIQRHVPDWPKQLEIREALTTEKGGITTKAFGSKVKK